jgi:hypothetical protein
MSAIHLAAGSDRVRCNRQGMRGAGERTIGALRSTDDLDAVTCRDCRRLGAIDLFEVERVHAHG